MGKKERVILIKGNDSQWYEQAIFIVNPKTPQNKIPKDFVAEAEMIIHNHIRKKYTKQANNNVGIAYAPASASTSTKTSGPVRPRKKAARRFDFVLNTIMAIGCLFIAAAIMWGIFG